MKGLEGPFTWKAITKTQLPLCNEEYLRIQSQHQTPGCVSKSPPDPRTRVLRRVGFKGNITTFDNSMEEIFRENGS